MKSFRTYLIALLALFLAGTSAFGWREYQELIKLRAQVASDDSADLRKRLADLQKRNWRLQSELDAAHGQNKREQGDPADPAGALADGPDRGGPGRIFGRFQAVMNNPQFQKLAALEAKARLDGSYAALFKSLVNGSAGVSLTPQQLDQFKNLLVQRQQALMDAMQAAREQGLDPRSDPQGFAQAIKDAQASVDQQIQSTLGDAGYAAYEQYQQTIPQRNTVNQVQQALSYTATPLTDAQAGQLTQILAQDQPQRAGSGTAGAANPGAAALRNLFNINQTAPITTQAVTDAQGVLSQPQLQALQQVQQAQQAQAQMMQLLRASRPATTAAAAAGPGG